MFNERKDTMNASKPGNFYQIIKGYVYDFWMKINITSRDIITYVSCFGAGFLLGIIIKRYGKWIVTILLVSVLVLLTLEYFQYITIHQEKLKAFLVDNNMQDFDSIMVQVKKYAIEVGIMVVAMLLGFKLG